MFTGETKHALDPKGRLTIPARFRDVLLDGLVITRGDDPCLVVRQPDAWDTLANKMTEQPITDRETRKYIRRFFSGSQRAKLDKMGRILVPAFLREHAHIDGEALIVGMGKEIEIWNPEIYQAAFEEDSERLDEIMAKASQRGL